MSSVPVSSEDAAFVRRRLKINSVSGLVRFAISSSVYLFLYPFLLHSLGYQRFGLWALLGISAQYAVIGDLGISNALIKQVAEASLDTQRNKIGDLAGSATAIFTLIGGAATALVFMFHRAILNALHVQPALLQEADVLLRGMVLVLWLTLLSNVYTSVLSGLHRMDLTNLIQTAGLVLNAVCSVVAIEMGAGLTGLMLSSAVTAIASWVAAVILVRRAGSGDWLVLPRAHRRLMGGLLSFGGYLYVAGLSTLLLDPMMKVLLTRFGSLEWVSEFELASRIVTQIRSLFANVMFPLLPAASLLSRDSASVHALFTKATRLLWSSAVPIFLVLSIMAGPLITVWLGHSLPNVRFGLMLLSLGWLCNVMTIAPYLLVQGLGKPHLAMACSLIQGGVSVAGSVMLIPRIGFSGAVYSETGAFVAAAAYILVSYLFLCPTSFHGTFGASWTKILLPPLGFGGILVLLDRVLGNSPALVVGCTVLIICTYGLISGGEILSVFSGVPSGRNRLFRKPRSGTV